MPGLGRGIGPVVGMPIGGNLCAIACGGMALPRGGGTPGWFWCGITAAAIAAVRWLGFEIFCTPEPEPRVPPVLDGLPVEPPGLLTAPEGKPLGPPMNALATIASSLA